MMYGVGLLSLMRPWNMTLGAASVAALLYFINPETYSKRAVMMPSLIVALTLGAGNVINDIFDIKADQINHPHRFLARHPEMKKAAWILFSALVFAVFILMIVTDKIFYLPLILLGLSIGFILVIYSLFLKRLLYIGNLAVALCAASVVPFSYLWLKSEGTLSLLRPPVTLILYTAIVFLVHFSRELTKSMTDSAGDLKRQAKTYLSAGHTDILVKVLRFNTLATSVLLILLFALLAEKASVFSVLLLLLIAFLFLKIFRAAVEISDTGKACSISRYHKLSMALGIISLVCWKS